jgi:sugar phosphate isomerase/epimerase
MKSIRRICSDFSVVGVVACLLLFAVSDDAPSAQKNQKIQIGYCAKLNEIETAKSIGFDYVELRTSEIAALSAEEFEKLAEKLKRLELPSPVMYLFIPGSIKLTGPNIDKRRQMEYVTRALDRVSRLGARVITFGSGAARQVPEGFSKREAFNQLVEFCKRLGPEARARKLTIAIEPQRRQECNIINSVAEALDLVSAVSDPAIQLMVDFYHLSEEKEDATVILRARLHIRHLHIANPVGRVVPLNRSEYDYGPFFENLKRIGYEGRISVETGGQELTQTAAQSITFLRSAFSR